MDTKTTIRNIRLNFPSITKHTEFKGKSTERYKNQLEFNKTDKTQLRAYAQVKKIVDFLVEQNPGLSPQNICLKDGDGDRGNEHTQGKYILRTSNKNRFEVRDTENGPFIADEHIEQSFTHGSTVNAIIRLYVYNDFLSCNLLALRLVESGLIGVTHKELEEL